MKLLAIKSTISAASVRSHSIHDSRCSELMDSAGQASNSVELQQLHSSAVRASDIQHSAVDTLATTTETATHSHRMCILHGFSSLQISGGEVSSVL